LGGQFDRVNCSAPGCFEALKIKFENMGITWNGLPIIKPYIKWIKALAVALDAQIHDVIIGGGIIVDLIGTGNWLKKVDNEIQYSN
jgi:hypothetical protein